MPLYEYQCHECNHRFERIERVSAPSDGVCPSCGGAARRLLGAPALQFKGAGWYVNDYGKGNGGRPSTTDTKSETPPATESPAPTPASTTNAKVA
jgi:putative FmdB family regulatory protein